MLIANPISDSVFKWLMEDTRIARFFIETILEETVTEVVLKQQELKYSKKDEVLQIASALSTVRLDYVATIKLATGGYKKVLIEIQNARNATDIMRFRNYLAQHYSRTDDILTDDGIKTLPLPIITIYLFGFKLPEVDTPVVKVSREYVDQVTHQVLHCKNDFIEQLTHDCYIVQIPRIQNKIQTKVEKLLSFFEQSNFIDDTNMYKDYPYPIDDDNIRLIANELHFAGTDPEKRRILEVEREAYRVIDVNIAAGLVVKDRIIQEKEKTILEKDKEIEDLKKQLREKGEN